MTADDWAAWKILYPLVDRLEGHAGGRKLWLFGCACCRRIWHLLSDEPGRRVVEVAERFVDGLASLEDFTSAAAAAAVSAEAEAAQEAGSGGSEVNLLRYLEAANRRKAAAAAAHIAGEIIGGPTMPHIRAAAFAAAEAASGTVHVAAARSPSRSNLDGPDLFRAIEGLGEAATAAGWAEEEAQCHVLRDIFWNPFRPRPAIASAWLTDTVRSLAEAAYQERQLPSGTLDPQRLAVLGDALEEVGAAGEMVEHLRAPGPHWRGCWCVDLLTGRE